MVQGVVSPGSGGLSGVQEHRPDTAIKAQHGCLAKMNTGSNFGCSVCRGAGGGGGGQKYIGGGHAVSFQCEENCALYSM